jgi:tRNA-specific 2-thiouridylase
VEVFDAYYDDNPQYRFIKDTVASLLKGPSAEPMLITDYISEDKASPSGSARNEYSTAALKAMDDATLLRLSQPVRYDALSFETEVYRSGKHHVKKTRYKANPYGKVAGRHEGAQFYTIGQRKGLNIGGHKDSIFVIGTDIERNIIYVGEGHKHKGLSRICLRVAPDEIHWIRPDLKMQPGDIRRYRVRIRYRQPLQDAFVLMRENGLYMLFDAPQRGITPGQFAVWYGEDGEMIGSGVI